MGGSLVLNKHALYHPQCLQALHSACVRGKMAKQAVSIALPQCKAYLSGLGTTGLLRSIIFGGGEFVQQMFKQCFTVCWSCTAPHQDIMPV